MTIIKLASASIYIIILELKRDFPFSNQEKIFPAIAQARVGKSKFTEIQTRVAPTGPQLVVSQYQGCNTFSPISNENKNRFIGIRMISKNTMMLFNARLSFAWAKSKFEIGNCAVKDNIALDLDPK